MNLDDQKMNVENARRNMVYTLRSAVYSSNLSMKFHMKDILTKAMYAQHNDRLDDILTGLIANFWKSLLAEGYTWDNVRFYLKGGTSINKNLDHLELFGGDLKILLQKLRENTVLKSISDWDCGLNISPTIPPDEYYKITKVVYTKFIELYNNSVRAFEGIDLQLKIPLQSITDIIPSVIETILNDIVSAQDDYLKLIGIDGGSIVYNQDIIPEDEDEKILRIYYSGDNHVDLTLPVDDEKLTDDEKTIVPHYLKISSLYSSLNDTILWLIALNEYVDSDENGDITALPAPYYSTFRYIEKDEEKEENALNNYILQTMLNNISKCSNYSTSINPDLIVRKVKFNKYNNVATHISRIIRHEDGDYKGKRNFDLFRLMYHYSILYTFKNSLQNWLGSKIFPQFKFEDGKYEYDRNKVYISMLEIENHQIYKIINPTDVEFGKLGKLYFSGFESELIDISVLSRQSNNYNIDYWNSLRSSNMLTIAYPGRVNWFEDMKFYPIASLKYFLDDLLLTLATSGTRKIQKRCERLYLLALILCMYYHDIGFISHKYFNMLLGAQDVYEPCQAFAEAMHNEVVELWVDENGDLNPGYQFQIKDIDQRDICQGMLGRREGMIELIMSKHLIDLYEISNTVNNIVVLNRDNTRSILNILQGVYKVTRPNEIQFAERFLHLNIVNNIYPIIITMIQFVNPKLFRESTTLRNIHVAFYERPGNHLQWINSVLKRYYTELSDDLKSLTNKTNRNYGGTFVICLNPDISVLDIYHIYVSESILYYAYREYDNEIHLYIFIKYGSVLYNIALYISTINDEFPDIFKRIGGTCISLYELDITIRKNPKMRNYLY